MDSASQCLDAVGKTGHGKSGKESSIQPCGLDTGENRKANHVLFRQTVAGHRRKDSGGCRRRDAEMYQAGVTQACSKNRQLPGRIAKEGTKETQGIRR